MKPPSLSADPSLSGGGASENPWRRLNSPAPPAAPPLTRPHLTPYPRPSRTPPTLTLRLTLPRCPCCPRPPTPDLETKCLQGSSACPTAALAAFKGCSACPTAALAAPAPPPLTWMEMKCFKGSSACPAAARACPTAALDAAALPVLPRPPLPHPLPACASALTLAPRTTGTSAPVHARPLPLLPSPSSLPPPPAEDPWRRLNFSGPPHCPTPYPPAPQPWPPRIAPPYYLEERNEVFKGDECMPDRCLAAPAPPTAPTPPLPSS